LLRLPRGKTLGFCMPSFIDQIIEMHWIKALKLRASDEWLAGDLCATDSKRPLSRQTASSHKGTEPDYETGQACSGA